MSSEVLEKIKSVMNCLKTDEKEIQQIAELKKKISWKKYIDIWNERKEHLGEVLNMRQNSKEILNEGDECFRWRPNTKLANKWQPGYEITSIEGTTAIVKNKQTGTISREHLSRLRKHPEETPPGEVEDELEPENEKEKQNQSSNNIQNISETKKDEACKIKKPARFQDPDSAGNVEDQRKIRANPSETQETKHV